MIALRARRDDFLSTEWPAYDSQYVVCKAAAGVGRQTFIGSIPCLHTH